MVHRASEKQGQNNRNIGQIAPTTTLPNKKVKPFDLSISPIYAQAQNKGTPVQQSPLPQRTFDIARQNASISPKPTQANKKHTDFARRFAHKSL